MFKIKINTWISFLCLLLVPFLAIADDVSISSVSHRAQILKNIGVGIFWFFIGCIAGAFIFQYFFKLEYKKAFWQMFKMKLWALLYWFLIGLSLGIVVFFMIILVPGVVEFFVALGSLSWSNVISSPTMILVIVCYTLFAYILSFYVFSYAYRNHVDSSVNQLILKKTIFVIILLDYFITLLRYFPEVIAFINPSIV